jgi:hypothetical protein
MSSRKAWTDEDIGYVMETLAQPVKDVARHLDRSVASISSTRSKLKAGWTGPEFSPWTAPEDAVIASMRYATAAEIAAKLPGRSEAAVNIRRSKIRAGGLSRNKKNPHAPGARTVVARTCRSCGLLLPSEWFSRKVTTRQGVSTNSDCRKCLSLSNQERVKRNGYVRPDRGDSRDIYRHRAQELTSSVAENNHQDYTEADHEILADPTITSLTKALRLKRTYLATLAACQKFGYVSLTHQLASPEDYQWLIDNPNADRIDEITASLAVETQESPEADEPRPAPSWDWDDADLVLSA